MALDRIKQLVADLVEHFVGARLDYHARYPCTVTLQIGNQLQLAPDDARMRGFGLASVELRHGLPGYLVTVPIGTRVLLGFDAGDPSRPYAALWEQGAVTSVAFDGGILAIARATDPTASGTIVIAQPGAPGLITMTYTPPGGPPVVSTLAATALTVLPNPTTFPLAGAIVSGNTKLLA